MACQGANGKMEDVGPVVGAGGSVSQPPVSATTGANDDPDRVPYTLLDVPRILVSTVLTWGGVSLIFYGIVDGKAALTSNKIVPIVIFILMTTLLGYLEGLQVAILSMQRTANREGVAGFEAWKTSDRTRAYNLQQLALKPDNVKKFLIGRQFLVIFVVMLLSQCASFPTLERLDWVPEVLWILYVDTGLYVALPVLAFGQLMPQLIAESHPDLFANLPGSIWVLYLTLVCEWSGIPAFCIPLSDLVLFIARPKNESGLGRDAQPVKTYSCGDYVRVAISSLLTLGGLAFIFYGIADGKAMLTTDRIVPFVILVVTITLLGYLEGLQVAILNLQNSEGVTWKHLYPRAWVLQQICNREDHVRRFLIGRQFYVIFVVMLLSQATSFPTLERPEEVPEVLWIIFVGTGLYGALVVLAFGQLMPQLVADTHPRFFCNLWGSWTVLWMTLICYLSGIPSFSKPLTDCVLMCCTCGRKRKAGKDLESQKPKTETQVDVPDTEVKVEV